MTQQLYDVLWDRYENRDKDQAVGVLAQSIGVKKPEPLLKALILTENVSRRRCVGKRESKSFRFHAIRHSGASILDINNISISSIQKDTPAMRIEPRPRSTSTVLENQSERRWTHSSVQGKNPTQKSHTAPEAPKKGQVVNLCKYLK